MQNNEQIKPAPAPPTDDETREFIEGLEAIGKHPDGARRLRFVAATMKNPASMPTTPQETWARYDEFCEKEAA